MMSFDANFEVRGVDQQGVLYAIADTLHRLTHYTVKHISLDTDDGIFEGKLTISVFDTSDVANICEELKQIESVTKAARI